MNKYKSTSRSESFLTIQSYMEHYTTFICSFNAVQSVEDRRNVFHADQNWRHMIDPEVLVAHGAAAGSVGTEGGDVALFSGATARVADAVAACVATSPALMILV